MKRAIKDPYILKNPFFKSLLLLLALMLVSALFVWTNLWRRINTNAVILLSDPEEVSEPIVTSGPYKQDFNAIGSFNYIILQFETFGRTNYSHINVELKENKTGDTIEIWRLDNNIIADGPTELSLKETVKKGQYRLEISSDNLDPESSVAIYLQDESKCDGILYIGGEVQNRDISIRLYKKTNIGYVRVLLIIAATIFMIWIAYLLFMIFKSEMWKTAFVLLMGFGCIYLFIFPAGTINDSVVHYITVYEYSNKLLGIPLSKSGTVIMRTDDAEELQRYYSTYHKNRFKSPSLAMYDEECDEFSLWCKDNTLLDSGYSDIYSNSTNTGIVAYLPAVVGLTAGRLLSLGTVPCMFLARFLMLLSVSVMISIAIKLSVIGKEILLIIALTPIFLQQITAFSYDGMAFGFAFLFIGFCTKAKYRSDEFPVHEYILFVLSTIGLCACRRGMYIILLIILLTIPNKVIKSAKKIYLVFVATTTVAILYGGDYLGTLSGATNDDNVLNLGSPFQNPIRIGMLFFSDLIENIDVYFGGLFGVRMGWNEAIVPYFCAFGFAVLLLLLSLSEECVAPFNWKSRSLYILPFVLTLGFCIVTMYIAQNSVATEWHTWGVQGRYLLPVLPLIAFQLRNDRIVLKKDIRPMILSISCGWELVEIYYLMKVYITR